MFTTTFRSLEVCWTKPVEPIVFEKSSSKGAFRRNFGAKKSQKSNYLENDDKVLVPCWRNNCNINCKRHRKFKQNRKDKFFKKSKKPVFSSKLAKKRIRTQKRNHKRQFYPADKPLSLLSSTDMPNFSKIGWIVFVKNTKKSNFRI